MNSERIESAPGAHELACDLLATYTGNDDFRTVTGNKDITINSIELIEDSGKAHYISAHHMTEHGGFYLSFSLNIHGNGIYTLASPDQDGLYGNEITSGHISDTLAEPVVRAHTEKMVAALTGHEVKLEEWVVVNGIHLGCHLVPCNSSDSPGHSFHYMETGDGHFDIYLGINSESDTPSFETSPFAEGLVSDILHRVIRYTCSLQITNPNLFCKSMQIDTLEEIDGKVLLDHIFASDTIPGSEGSIVSYLAMDNLDCDGLDIDDENNDIISMTVVACIEDHRAFVALARDSYQNSRDDNDWYPDSMSNALKEITLASNDNPEPHYMGFEIYDVDLPEPEMVSLADSDPGTPEP